MMNSRHRHFRFASNLEYLLVPLFLLLFVILWRLVVRIGNYPTYLLPLPEDVWRRFISYAAGGQLRLHVTATLIEVLGGFLLGTTAGLISGYPIAKIKALERIAVPYIVAWQSIPVVALAPLMIIWFGTGYFSKILVAAMITFFPVLINAVVGFRAIERKYLRLMASLNATRRDVFFKIEVPRALPTLFAGFRIAAPLAVVGAVVGEFLGASQGLGFLIRISQGLLDTPLMFVALLTLVLMGILFYLVFVLLEKLTLHQVHYF
jgi:NitT/TauT family transport system permease protein